jgi:hypothetical protein
MSVSGVAGMRTWRLVTAGVHVRSCGAGTAACDGLAAVWSGPLLPAQMTLRDTLGVFRAVVQCLREDYAIHGVTDELADGELVARPLLSSARGGGGVLCDSLLRPVPRRRLPGGMVSPVSAGQAA